LSGENAVADVFQDVISERKSSRTVTGCVAPSINGDETAKVSAGAGRICLSQRQHLTCTGSVMPRTLAMQG
jgi:hypothetical protein